MTEAESSVRNGVTRDPRPALIVAAILLGIMIVRILLSLAWWGPGVRELDTGMMSAFGRQVALESLPFAIGVFLMLWILPVRASDRVVVVLLKGLAATAAAALLVVAVGLASTGVQAGLGFLRDLQYVNPISQVWTVISTIIAAAPLVMLVVLVQQLVARPGARS